MFFVVVIKLTYVWYLLRNMTVLESMMYNKRLLIYVGKFIKNRSLPLVPTRSVTVRATAPYFRPCFPVQWNLKLSVNSVRAWLKVVTHCHFHHVHNLHSVVLYRPHSLTHPPTDSLTHTLTHILTHSLTHSLTTHTHSHTHTHTHPLTHSPTYVLIHALILSLTVTRSSIFTSYSHSECF